MKKIYLIIILTCILMFYSILFVFDRLTIEYITVEDGFIENLGAIFFFLTSIFFFLAFKKEKKVIIYFL